MYKVVFAPEALQHLIDLSRYIANKGFPKTADTYTASIVDYCESLSTFPERDTCHNTILSGLRTVPYKRSATVAFKIDKVTNTIAILGIFSGGQNYLNILEEIGERE